MKTDSKMFSTIVEGTMAPRMELTIGFNFTAEELHEKWNSSAYDLSLLSDNLVSHMAEKWMDEMMRMMSELKTLRTEMIENDIQGPARIVTLNEDTPRKRSQAFDNVADALKQMLLST